MTLPESAIKHKLMTEQDESLILEGWVSFPVSRPIQNTKVKVFINNIEKTGLSKLTTGANSSGIAILAGGFLYDSNHQIWWKTCKTLEEYIDELKANMIELYKAYEVDEDLVMRDKYCLVREIVHQLESLEGN